MLFSLLTTIGLAFKNLQANKLRTFLTLLGIIISIVAIMLIIVIGENVKQFVNAQVESFGTSYVQIEVKVPQADTFSQDNIGGRIGTKITTLTIEDADAVRSLPYVNAVSPGIVDQRRFTVGENTETALIFGSGAQTPQTDAAMKIASGRFYTEAEERSFARVAVLGSTLKEELFGPQTAVGEVIKVAGKSYRVVGVLDKRGADLFDFDAVAYIPVTTVQKTLLGVDHVDWITVDIEGRDRLTRASGDITQILRLRHGITDPNDDDFSVSTPDQLLGQIGQIFSVINILLIALASISLVVGGVGIMNVMLVAVEERTSEIGLRKSLGARRGDIVRQFLVEALVIALIGAVVGMILGFALIFAGFAGARAAGFPLAEIIPPFAPVVAILFSLTAGLLFGTYPAKKAASISPIEALRS